MKIQSKHSFTKDEKQPGQNPKFQERAPSKTTDEDYTPGFYSSTGKVFVEKDHPLEIQIIVHELTHALQDQHYVIETFQNPPDIMISEDESNARSSVVEGEARLMQYLYDVEMKKTDIITSENVQNIIEKQLKGFESSNSSSSGDLLNTFIYHIGMRFILSLSNYAYDPDVLNTLFSLPPLSTDEVFFPQKYLDKKPFYAYAAFNTDLLDNFFSHYSHKQTQTKVLTFGKLTLSSIVKSALKPSDIFLKDLGWNGDRILVYAKNSNQKQIDENTLLLSLSKWDSSEDAYNYALYLEEMINERSKDLEDFEKVFEADDTSEYSFTFKGKKHYILIKVKNDRLVYVENLPDFMLGDFRMLDSQIFNFLTEDWVS